MRWICLLSLALSACIARDETPASDPVDASAAPDMSIDGAADVAPPPVDAAPSAPAPVEPAPAEPEPVEPEPVEPEPIEPEPSEPEPSEPEPSEPEPVEPEPSEPEPAEPEPAEPEPAEPEPAEPEAGGLGYAMHVQPILAAHCGDCHGNVGSRIGGFAVDYATTQAPPHRLDACADTVGECIGRVLSDARVEGRGCRTFEVETFHRSSWPCLAEADVDTVHAWIEQGMQP